MSEESAPDLRRRVEPIHRAEPTWSPHGIRLLDIDPDFGTGLSHTELADVEQQVVLPTLRLERGLWEIEQLRQAPGVRGEPRGFLVVTGAVTIDLAIAGQVCTRLLTPRELVLLDGWRNSIPVRAGWSVLDSAMLAVLDHRIAVIGARWPGLMDAILKRAAQQVRRALLQQAMSQLPRASRTVCWRSCGRSPIARASCAPTGSGSTCR